MIPDPVSSNKWRTFTIPENTPKVVNSPITSESLRGFVLDTDFFKDHYEDGFCDLESAKDLIIPEAVDQLIVTGFPRLQSIVLPNSMSALHICEAPLLREVELPENIEKGVVLDPSIYVTNLDEVFKNNSSELKVHFGNDLNGALDVFQ